MFDSPPLADEGPACSDAAWASGQGYNNVREWHIVQVLNVVMSGNPL